jgi:hypothetical protein
MRKNAEASSVGYSGGAGGVQSWPHVPKNDLLVNMVVNRVNMVVNMVNRVNMVHMVNRSPQALAPTQDRAPWRRTVARPACRGTYRIPDNEP